MAAPDSAPAPGAPPEEGKPPENASSFPPPPPYFRLYAGGAASGPPPPPPVEEPLDLFGAPFRLDAPLVSTAPNEMIRAQPDGSIDYRSQLQSLIPELLPLYLELLRCLEEAPEAYAGPLSRVSQALAAAQHLLNLVRPPQARATLEHILELEVKDKEEEIAKIRKQVQALDQLLQEAGQQLVNVAPQQQQQQASSQQAAMDMG